MLLDFLLNPNLAYIVLVFGLWLLVMAVLTPGTGVFELGALFAFLLAGWQISSMPINWWALVILVIGVVPFMVAVLRSRKMLFLFISILTLVVGSIYMFQGDGLAPAVNPVLAIVVSSLTAGFMWFVTVKTLEAQHARPAHDLEMLIGAEGITRTPIYYEGAVLVQREEWSARSKTLIPVGERIRVIGREGFVLLVEPWQE